MKIKKPMKVKTGGGEGGSGAIADRFKLDAPAGGKAKSGGSVNRKSAMWALIFGLVAFGVSVALVVVLYKHWEYLMPA